MKERFVISCTFSTQRHLYACITVFYFCTLKSALHTSKDIFFCNDGLYVIFDKIKM